MRFDRTQLTLDAAVQGLDVALEGSTIAATHFVEEHFVVRSARHAKRPEVTFALRRAYLAVFWNERYRFTTWRWGVPLASLVALGALIKVLA